MKILGFINLDLVLYFQLSNFGIQVGLKAGISPKYLLSEKVILKVKNDYKSNSK